MVVHAERVLIVQLDSLGAAVDGVSGSTLLAAIRESVRHLFGDFGVGSVQSSLQVKHFCASAGFFLVRVARRHASTVRAAVCSVRFIQQRPVRMTAIHTAGSLRTARRTMIVMLEKWHREWDGAGKSSSTGIGSCTGLGSDGHSGRMASRTCQGGVMGEACRTGLSFVTPFTLLSEEANVARGTVPPKRARDDVVALMRELVSLLAAR